uniref:Uncharacterized protein n=1 Tax=Acrobeloides nanus TaxID=290746 RepID=A0A914C577_9BILA
MLSGLYGYLDKNFLVFETRPQTSSKEKIGGFELKKMNRPSTSKFNGVHKIISLDDEYEIPTSQIKELNEANKKDEHYGVIHKLSLPKTSSFGPLPSRLQPLDLADLPPFRKSWTLPLPENNSEFLQMPSKNENVVNHTTKKDWRRNCFVFSLASLMVIGIIKLIYMWLVPSCNLYEGIFIDEGSSISELIKLPADTSSCDRGTVWYYNSTNISNEFSFFVHSQPKHCKDFCMCDSTKTCYRPKNNSNYMVGFKHHCEKSCQFSSMIMDKPFESFLDENGNEINTPDEHYVKVDSFGCHGCDSLRKCPTCNKQRTLDNVQITANGTTVEITWNVTSKFSIVELEVYNASTTRIWREKNAQSPIFVPSHLIDPDEKYILSVYFYQDRRINNVKKRMWTIAFNLNLYNHEN